MELLMRNIFIFLIVFSCSSPDYQTIIDELEMSRKEIAKENARQLDFFRFNISELKSCYQRDYPELDSAFNSIAQLTEYKQRIVNSVSNTELEELVNSIRKFEQEAIDKIELNQDNPLSSRINKDLEILNGKLSELPTNILRQLLISKLERWNLLATELKLGRYAIDPCLNPYNNR